MYVVVNAFVYEFESGFAWDLNVKIGAEHGWLLGGKFQN